MTYAKYTMRDIKEMTTSYFSYQISISPDHSANSRLINAKRIRIVTYEATGLLN
jgi:hypothetical protein